MKILTLDANNNLVWQEAIYEGGRFRYPDGSKTFADRYIYSVKDDDRNKTVICSACGKEIPNTPAAIKAHKNMINKSNKCFECGHLKHMNPSILTHKYTLNEDGTYTENTKRTINLKCGMAWDYTDINSEESRGKCKYARCENAQFRQIEDFWTKYPGAFDELITIDRIIDNGYKTMHKFSNSVEFELKGKGNIEVKVNNQGICYEISVSRRKNTYTLRYSKKYDKLWVWYGSDWKSLSSLYLATDTEEAIVKKIKALYK